MIALTTDHPAVVALFDALRAEAKLHGLPERCTMGVLRRHTGEASFIVSSINDERFLTGNGDDFDAALKAFTKQIPAKGQALAQQKRADARRLLSEAEEIESESQAEVAR